MEEPPSRDHHPRAGRSVPYPHQLDQRHKDHIGPPRQRALDRGISRTMNAPRAAGSGLLITVLATALVIAGCGLFNRSGEDDRFVRPGEPKTSPSGRFTA